MTQSASLSLKTQLRRIEQEPPLVQFRRHGVLAARGLVEMLVLRAIAARELLAHGVYQANLNTGTPGRHALAPSGAAQLREVLDALTPAVHTLRTAMDECACIGVGFNASPDGIAVIAAELDDCHNRLKHLDATELPAWRNALAEYERRKSKLHPASSQEA